MEELIFFAVIIIFSVIESIAKSRRQRKGGPLPDVPAEVEAEQEWPPSRRRGAPGRPSPSIPPSYDDDAIRSLETETSHDEMAAAEVERRRRATSSESMIPADIWEEIAGRAREAKVERPKPTPPAKPRPQPHRMPPPAKRPVPMAQPRPRPPAPRVPAGTVSRSDVEGTAQHPVHLSHAGYGTDPSERAPSAQDALRPLARAVNEDADAVRQQLRQGRDALRRAVILQEVLGPPMASRPDRFDE